MNRKIFPHERRRSLQEPNYYVITTEVQRCLPPVANFYRMFALANSFELPKQTSFWPDFVLLFRLKYIGALRVWNDGKVCKCFSGTVLNWMNPLILSAHTFSCVSFQPCPVRHHQCLVYIPTNPNMKKCNNFLIIPHPAGTIQTPQRFLRTFPVFCGFVQHYE